MGGGHFIQAESTSRLGLTQSLDFMTTSPLQFEPLKVSHLSELASVMLHPLVYEHIDDGVPSLDEFKLGLTLALDGPGKGLKEHWLNYLVRDGAGTMLGRLEATVHDAIAEVAFLFAPEHWGKGYANEGLAWLETEVMRCTGVTSFWATTTPANLRCQALLARSGYSRALDSMPFLHSYEHGDLVFRRVVHGA